MIEVMVFSLGAGFIIVLLGLAVYASLYVLDFLLRPLNTIMHRLLDWLEAALTRHANRDRR